MRQGFLAVWVGTLVVFGAWNSGWGQDTVLVFEEPLTQPLPDVSPGSRPLSQRLQTIESRLYELESRPQSSLIHGSPTGHERLEGEVPSLIGETLEEGGEEFRPRFYLDYDGGFVIRPFDKQETPYELKTRARMQFRYVGFSRDTKTWTNNAGRTIPVETRNDFEIERARLEFLGFFFDSNLQFYINLDADSDDTHGTKFHDFWINYVFSDALNVHVGKAFVPGSRDWLSGSTRSHLVDRSMGTTFFRPDRTVGVWAIGVPIEGLHYRAMSGNDFNTTGLRPRNINEP